MLSDPGHRVGKMPSLPGPIGLQPNFNRRLDGPNKELGRAVSAIHTAADFANTARAGFQTYKAAKGMHEAHARATAAQGRLANRNAALSSYQDAWAAADPAGYGNSYQGGVSGYQSRRSQAARDQYTKSWDDGLASGANPYGSSYNQAISDDAKRKTNAVMGQYQDAWDQMGPDTYQNMYNNMSGSYQDQANAAAKSAATRKNPLKVQRGTQQSSPPATPPNPPVPSIHDQVKQQAASRQRPTPPPVQTTSTPTQPSGATKSIPPKTAPEPAPTPTPFRVNPGTAGGSQAPTPSNGAPSVHDWAAQQGPTRRTVSQEPLQDRAKRVLSGQGVPQQSSPTAPTVPTRSMPPRPVQPAGGRPVPGTPTGVPNNFDSMRSGATASPPPRDPLTGKTRKPRSPSVREPRGNRPRGVGGTLGRSMDRSRNFDSPFIPPSNP